MKFRKKPVEIEAITVKDAINCFAAHWDALPKWLSDAYEAGTVLPVSKEDGIYINTLEGKMHAKAEDYLICGVKGEIYPCKPDIFELTYEAV